MSITEFSGDSGLFADDAPAITVLGVGNIVLQDEGFGVRVLEYLAEHYLFPETVQLLDGGTLGMELLHFIPGTKQLLVLDAIKTDDGAGHCYTFRNDEVKAHFQDKLSAHEVGVQDVLALLELTGRAPDEVVVMGASPFVLEAGTELSAELLPLVKVIAQQAVLELQRWGVEVQPKKQ